MTFVVSGNQKSYLRKFTELLFSAFPGIMVYEYMNADDAVKCVKTHRIDAVFIDAAWDAANEFRLLRSLRRENTALPVYAFAENDQHELDALWHEATAYLLEPWDAAALSRALPAAVRPEACLNAEHAN